MWPRRDAGPATIGALANAAVPLLVILDYAETRTGTLTALLDACAQRSASSPVRLLLLARTAGSWWRETQAGSRAAEELLGGAAVIALPELESDHDGLRAAYREATAALAAALPRVRGHRQEPWGDLAATMPVPGFGPAPVTALTVHMTALVALLDRAAQQHPAGSFDDVEDRLLVHEERYWHLAAAEQGLAPGKLSRETIREAMAAAMLFGADTGDAADTLLSHTAGLTDQPYDTRRAVRSWIASLYPPRQAGLPWDQLYPDRLAERFFGRFLADHPQLPATIMTAAGSSQRAQLLTVYSRAAAHTAFAGRLDQPLAALAASLPAQAIEAASRAERPGPLIQGLDRLVDDPSTPVKDLDTLSELVPEVSHVLAPWGTRIFTRLAGHYRQLATGGTWRGS